VLFFTLYLYIVLAFLYKKVLQNIELVSFARMISCWKWFYGAMNYSCSVIFMVLLWCFWWFCGDCHFIYCFVTLLLIFTSWQLNAEYCVLTLCLFTDSAFFYMQVVQTLILCLLHSRYIGACDFYGAMNQGRPSYGGNAASCVIEI